MISNELLNQLQGLTQSANLTPSVESAIHILMISANREGYSEGFDYGCVRSREESIPLGTLADMTIQELVNLIGTDDD